MILRSTRYWRKAFQSRPSQEGELFPFCLQPPSHAHRRWLSSALAYDVEEILNVVDDHAYCPQELILPVQARGRPRHPCTKRRWKPVSLPAADFPIEVEQLVNVVRRKGLSPDLEESLNALCIRVTAFHVSKALSSVDDAESAIRFLAWASEQPEFCHNSYTCTRLVSILAHAKQFEKIWELLSELHASGVKLDDGLFNVTIKAYGKMGNGREAIRTLKRMQEFGVSPTSYSYNTLLSVLLKSHQLNLAMEVYSEILQDPLVREDRFSHSMMVSALCEAGRLEDAYVIVEEKCQEGVHANSFIWTSLVNGFCKVGNMKKALELFSKMKNMGLEPNVVTYSSIIAGFCKLGKLSDAAAYLDLMERDGIMPNDITYTPLLDAFCKAERIDEGHELLKKLLSNGKRGNTIQYSIFVYGYSKLGRMDEACALYDEMLKAGCSPSSWTYAMLIRGLCKAGWVKEALKYFKEMRERTCGATPAIYKSMVEALASAGLKNEARKMFQAMLDEGYAPIESTCSGLVKSLCQQGSLDSAKETLAMMRKDGKVTVSSVNTFLKGLCDASQVDSAYQYFKEMLTSGFEPTAQTYNILIHGALKAGDFEKTASFFSEMVNKGFNPDIYTFASLCQAAWKAKQADTLVDIYQCMKKWQVRANPFVFTILIKALSTMNKVPEACEVCFQILRDGFDALEGNEKGSFLDDRSFIKVRVFLPILIHLQECGDTEKLVGIWDFILQNELFSWIKVDGNDSHENVQ